MHRVQQYLDLYVLNNKPSIGPTNVVLSNQQATALASICAADSRDLLHSALISYASAIRGLLDSFYTWPIVSSYYAGYLACRSLLYSEGIVLFYVNRKPFSIRIHPGEIPRKRKGNTHEATLALFNTSQAGVSLNSQPIDFLNPLDWLREKREYFNYRVARYVEPSPPACISVRSQRDPRKLLAEYVRDPSLYAFDPDHAILALPWLLIKRATKALTQPWTAEDTDQLRHYYRDSQGPIAILNTLAN